MKKISLLISASFILFSTLSFADSLVTNIPVFQGGVTQQMVYQNGSDAIKACQKQSGDINKCLVNYAKQNGASTQVVEFFKLTTGYIKKFDKHGNIAIVTAKVVAADHDQEVYVINTDGDFINPNTSASSQEVSNVLNSDPLFKALGKNGYNPMSFLQTDVAPQVKNIQGLQSVIFSYRLTNCMACENAGIAKIAYNFDNTGKFKNISVIDIKAAKNKS